MAASEEMVALLRAKFAGEIQTNVPLARYTSARIGGPADFLISAKSADQLADIVSTLWQNGTAYLLLGGGSNVLVGDNGVRGITILNRAKAVRFGTGSEITVWGESGVVFSNLANRCAGRGLSGLEWAASVPGTLGGAVYGNAGAFGADMTDSLAWAEVLTPVGRERWLAEAMGYGYRTSILKQHQKLAVVLAAEMKLRKSTKVDVMARMMALGETRKASQPSGASMGSMFKNPPGDKAGRLIEAAGMKGRRIGDAGISPVHANFFLNHGEARAADVRALIEVAQEKVLKEFGIQLELEIEMVGE